MLISPFFLSKQGILGMNRRNVDYINKYNQRQYYVVVDNKLNTKQMASKFNIPTPTLQGVIRYQYEILHFEKIVKDLKSFVIKPSKGAVGKGIIVVKEHSNGVFTTSSGKKISLDNIKRHLSNILAGLYSLAGSPDVVIIEDMIETEESLKELSFEGVPDIRVIVFKGFPVMAMLRLSTKVSDGKANLHKGGVGVGLDIKTGRALNAIQFSKPITKHPDSGIDLKEISISNWKELLLLAARCYEMTKLGYIGVDIVIDKNLGPLILEVNARPGLAIQVASGLGLLPRLKKIEQLDFDLYYRPEDRVEQIFVLF